LDRSIGAVTSILGWQEGQEENIGGCFCFFLYGFGRRRPCKGGSRVQEGEGAYNIPTGGHPSIGVRSLELGKGMGKGPDRRGEEAGSPQKEGRRMGRSGKGKTFSCMTDLKKKMERLSTLFFEGERDSSSIGATEFSVLKGPQAGWSERITA